MQSRISPELVRVLAELTGSPETRVPVIVTLAPGEEPAAVERAGLAIDRRFDTIRAVAGTAVAREIPALGRLDAVELIELDSETRAHGSSLGSAPTG